jgi:hypothetical protein
MTSLMAKGCFSIIEPEKSEEAQHTRIPPDAPIEGQNSNLSNLLGENFLIKNRSKLSLLVSWRQKIFAEHSSILFLMASHLTLSLLPLTFQHKIFQDLLAIKNKKSSRDRKMMTQPPFIKFREKDCKQVRPPH